MLSNLFLRRLLIPVSGSFVVYAAKTDDKTEKKEKDKEKKGDTKDKSGKNKEEECPPKKKVIAKDLPLYVDDPDCPKCKEQNETIKPSILTDTIRCAREELWVIKDEVVVLSKQFSSYFLVAKRHTENTLEYLREECNVAPRMGAIALGGLAGYVLALRKSRFKRFLYTGAGATAMAALCYPKEAKEYSDEGLKQMKKYVIITYHFLNGVMSKDEVDMDKLEGEGQRKGAIASSDEQESGDDDNVYVQKTVPGVSSYREDPACRCPRHPRFQKEQNKKDKNKDKKDKDTSPPKCEGIC